MENTEARQALSTALATYRRLQGELASLYEASNGAAEVAQDTRTALDAIESAVRRQARVGLEGDQETDAVDLEPRITACKRRLEATDEVQRENSEAVRALQPQVADAGEAVRWAAKAVLETEGEALLARYERVQRDALTLRWRIEKLSGHLMKTRGASENQRFAAFDAPHRLIERLKNALYCDETERWPVGEFEQAWAAFEQELMTDSDATVPDVAVKRTGA